MIYNLYSPKKILNVHKHINGGMFWEKYTAHPYIGCQHGCKFCYAVGTKYCSYKNTDDYSTVIMVKENAPQLLTKELSKVKKDIIIVGDYQPAEAKYMLSRKMLEVCLELQFPVLIIERSPLVLRDLDILIDINKQSWACVIFSISYYTSKGYQEFFEPTSPLIESRFEAMKKIAFAGINTGIAFMPILPFICDSDENIEKVILNTKESAGQFVIPGGLSLEIGQKEKYMEIIKKYFPDKVVYYEEYLSNNYFQARHYSCLVSKKVNYFCNKHNLPDMMARYISTDQYFLNKKVAEKLFFKIHDMEIKNESISKIWEYRKAAWSIDEMQDDIGVLFSLEGLNGLKKIASSNADILSNIAMIINSI